MSCKTQPCSLFLLLPIILAAAPAGAQTQEENTWVLDHEFRCKDQAFPFASNVRIAAGGALILEGCTFQMDPPPYQNRWLGAVNEGLTMRVDAGGRLEMRPSATNASTLESYDPRYGYTLTVEGLLVSDGLPGSPNRIRNLEGYMAEASIGGGLLVSGGGRAYLNHTIIEDIQGPAIFVHGGEAYARDVTVRKASGDFAVINGTLAVDGADMNTGIEAIRVVAARLTLEGVRAGADRVALHATRSDVTVRNSTLGATHNAVILVDSNATFEDCQLNYGLAGLLHQRGRTPASPSPHLVRLSRCNVHAFLSTERNSFGVSVDQADLEIADSHIANNTAGAIATRNGSSLHLVSTLFDNLASTDVFVSDAPAIALSGNTYSAAAAAKPVRVTNIVEVHVLDGRGRPALDAEVRLGGRTDTTNPNGTARLAWEPPLGDDQVPTSDSTAVQVTWKGRTMEKLTTPSERVLTFDFQQEDTAIPSLPLAWVVAIVLALAAGWRLRRR